jgi:hypothetical protein
MSRPDYSLPEPAADALYAEFRARRDLARKAGHRTEAATWAEAFRLLASARARAFAAATQTPATVEP